MKLSAKTTKALNAQIGMEAEAANSYLAVASWCEHTGYAGATKFFYQQYDEELQHMLKIVHFLNGRGIPAEIPAVKKPTATFKSLEESLKESLKHEQAVTASVLRLFDTVTKEKSHAAVTLAQWFVDEQAGEEEKFETILANFDLIGRDGVAVHEIDKILGSMASPPTP